MSTRGLTETEIADIEAAIKRSKNVRSWLDRLRVFLSNRSRVPVVAIAMMSGETLTVHPFAVAEISVAAAVPMIAAAHYGAEIVTVYPR